MNIFNKYGIKEVADVIFYSITRIGDEEFYTPVLFFDTLKVSTLTKNVETVNGKGGKANGKLLSWNFESDSKLRLEDALFSQMSLDMFMNGRVISKLSNWTSLIAKLNVANKYGQNIYSTYAYASPKLTKEEEEILFRCAQKAGYDAKKGAMDNADAEIKLHQSKYVYDTINRDKEGDAYVAENRKILLENYYKRTQPTPYPRDLASYIDFNNKYSGVQILIEKSGNELSDVQHLKQLEIGQKQKIERDIIIKMRDTSQEGYAMLKYQTEQTGLGTLQVDIKKTALGYIGITAAIDITNLTNVNDSEELIPRDFFPNNIRNGQWSDIGDEFFLSHVSYFLFPNYLEELITNLCYCDQRDKSQKAMPQKIIDEIANEINNFKRIGYFENNLYESDYIDRFEKCIVNKKNGQKIDLTTQVINLKKQYNNEKDNYIVYYDEKTMLPFMLDKTVSEKIYSQKRTTIVSDTPITKDGALEAIKNYFRDIMNDDWIDSLTVDDFIITSIDFEIKIDANSDITSKTFSFKIIKHEYITLKYGTVYYKWSRTVNEDNSNTTFIGTDISIDIDTFPGEYMIVGETYIREQKTGKDQRYQFVVNRAAISPQTKIQLQAAGEPTTFTIDIDLLMPKVKKKAMIELKQYNVEEDKKEGGYRIAPQNKKHSYTSTIQTYNEIVIENKEIY